MTDPHPHMAQLRLQLAEIALTPAGMQERAAAVLETLSGLLPFDAAWLAVRDPEARRHTPLATAGAAEPLRSYFQTPVADAEVEALGLNRHRPPMLASEIPVPLSELHGWADHLLPAGFRGGVAAGLFAPGGRHVGFLSLLSEDPSRPGPADREVIAAVSTVIAHGLNRTHEITDMARIVQAAFAGVVLTRGGDTAPLPGLPDHRSLVAGSALLATAAAELADGDTHRSFLAPTGSDGEGLLRVTALDCARRDLDHLTAAVLLSPPGDLRGLSARDLRVLGLLAAGVTQHPALATGLGLDERAVADALAAAQLALQASDLTATATYAIRSGLRIPPQLGTCPSPATG